jgi:hypothetical protein
VLLPVLLRLLLPVLLLLPELLLFLRPLLLLLRLLLVLVVVVVVLLLLVVVVVVSRGCWTLKQGVMHQCSEQGARTTSSCCWSAARSHSASAFSHSAACDRAQG